LAKVVLTLLPTGSIALVADCGRISIQTVRWLMRETNFAERTTPAIKAIQCCVLPFILFKNNNIQIIIMNLIRSIELGFIFFLIKTNHPNFKVFLSVINFFFIIILIDSVCILINSILIGHISEVNVCISDGLRHVSKARA
jgi:hypothetical protein